MSGELLNREKLPSPMKEIFGERISRFVVPLGRPHMEINLKLCFRRVIAFVNLPIYVDMVVRTLGCSSYSFPPVGINCGTSRFREALYVEHLDGYSYAI